MERITVLASSRKFGGICLAGKSADGRWIRPVSHGKAPAWTAHLLCQRLGRVPKTGDRVAVPCLYPTPLEHQSENHIVGTGSWLDAGHADSGEIARMAESEAPLWTSGQKSLGGINDRITTQEALLCKTGSLRLIRPRRLRFVEHQICGQPKLRAEFVHGGHSYLLCVTDTDARMRWHEYLQSGHDGYADALLCISLGLPFDGYCYKLVAGVIELH